MLKGGLEMRARSKIISLLIISVTLSAIFFAGAIENTAYALSIDTGLSEPDISHSREIPDAYCMKDDYIVFAQNQDAHGYCWNFAATMSASTTLMKATGEYYDFSELWFGVAAVVENGHSKIGAGGSFTTQYEAMKDAGVMLESDLPYQNSYTVSNDNAADYYNFHYKYSNDNISDCLEKISFEGRNLDNVDAIKEHIYNHGSLYISFGFRTGFIDDGDAYYLTPNQKNHNSVHAVSIIGWDDNYSKTLTVNGVTKEYKGAWIVLNSYTETNSKEGQAFIFYEDTNISSGYSVYGYKYVTDTEKDFYFYDKIESGYAYPTNVKGKYHSDFVAETATTKQKNIFYDDVDLEYSYLASDGVEISSINIYLANRDVTNLFSVRIDGKNKRFYISRDDAAYGQYKVLVRYTNGEESDTYLNNFFVTYGLIGEGMEFKTEDNDLGFRTPRDLEFFGFTVPNKNYVIYTNKLSGTVSFVPLNQSVYSEKNMSVPPISYEITDGIGCTRIHSVTSNSGYELKYTFNFEYCEDTTMQPVNVYYDLGGGINHNRNYGIELASPTSGLLLYPAIRRGYTFKGWYLDYGNGQIPLKEQNGMYRIDWDDIHHMGETPPLNASSHYKNYYNNSNTVFVYARWEEDKYYDVEITSNGNGSAQISDKISLRYDDSVKYIFTPETGYCISRIEINGAAVSNERLADIAANGLTIEKIDQNISIDVTYSKGYYLIIDAGENIKSAYVEITTNGKTERYYNGQCVPSPSRIGSVRSYTIVVEVFEDENGYTYILDNAEDYTSTTRGVYKRSVFMYPQNRMLRFSVGSATRKPIREVELSYTFNEHVISHYMSSNENAFFGDRDNKYITGEIVYLFIKMPADTAQYRYYAPSGFEPIDRSGWYRKAICVDPDAADLGEVYVERKVRSYTVTWQNWDGSEMYSESYLYGEVPVFDGTVTREGSGGYGYAFSGWDKTITSINDNVTYVAQFTMYPIEFAVNIETTEGGSVTNQNGDTITCEDIYTYVFAADTGYKISDVVINGVSVGAVNYYTLKDVTENQNIQVTFEPLSYTVTWQNWDGSVILTESCYYGDTPVFSGEIPSKPGEGIYIYEFVGWDPDIKKVRSDVTYTALFTQKIKEYAVEVVCEDNGSATPTGASLVPHGSGFTVLITPSEGFEIDRIKINGKIVDVSEQLTLKDITEDLLIEISFKRTVPIAEIIIIYVAAAVVAGAATFTIVFFVRRRRSLKQQRHERIE